MILLEVILSIALFSIVALVSSKTLLGLSKKDHFTREILNTNLKLESTRFYLVSNGLDKLKFINHNLYFNDNLLLENISKFNITSAEHLSTINICLFEDICQKWKISK